MRLLLLLAARWDEGGEETPPFDLFFSRFRCLSFSFLFTFLGLLLLLALSKGTSMNRERVFRPFTSRCVRVTASNLARLSRWRSSSWEALPVKGGAAAAIVGV